MVSFLQKSFALRKGLVASVLVMLTLGLALTTETRADDPPYYGQIITTNYYQDETYTGIYVVCQYNSCTEQESCLGQKTEFGVEVNRVTIPCDPPF